MTPGIDYNQILNVKTPVFITGRGGSGTRLLSNILLHADLFLGSELNHQGDSLEWLEINRKLIVDNITIENGKFTKEWENTLIEVAQSILNQADHSNYKCWGAKLPEFMLCIPELMSAFPQAKIIHLIRHPISLCNRRTHITSRWGNPVGEFVLKNAYQTLGLDVVRKKHFNNAVSWYYQVEKMIAYANTQLTEEQYLMVRFEDIISDSKSIQDKVFKFLNIEPVNTADLNIDPSRTKIEIPKSIEADEIWDICGDVALQAGYTKYKT